MTEPVTTCKGQVKFFFFDRGFGFIKRDDGERDVFLSVNKLPKDCTVLTPGQRCQFIVEQNPKKGPYAKEFQLL